MTQICINKICFEFSIYHFIFLFLLIILGNMILDCFKSKKSKLTENLWNINYDVPDVNLYPGQYLTRSTTKSKKAKDYDELTKEREERIDNLKNESGNLRFVLETLELKHATTLVA